MDQVVRPVGRPGSSGRFRSVARELSKVRDDLLRQVGQLGVEVLLVFGSCVLFEAVDVVCMDRAFGLSGPEGREYTLLRGRHEGGIRYTQH